MKPAISDQFLMKKIAEMAFFHKIIWKLPFRSSFYWKNAILAFPPLFYYKITIIYSIAHRLHRFHWLATAQAEPSYSLDILKPSWTDRLLIWSQAELAPSAQLGLVWLSLDLTTLPITMLKYNTMNIQYDFMINLIIIH